MREQQALPGLRLHPFTVRKRPWSVARLLDDRRLALRGREEVVEAGLDVLHGPETLLFAAEALWQG